MCSSVVSVFSVCGYLHLFHLAVLSGKSRSSFVGVGCVSLLLGVPGLLVCVVCCPWFAAVLGRAVSVLLAGRGVRCLVPGVDSLRLAVQEESL